MIGHPHRHVYALALAHFFQVLAADQNQQRNRLFEVSSRASRVSYQETAAALWIVSSPSRDGA